jgi:hypothetical protein
MAAINNEVAIGRRINGREGLTVYPFGASYEFLYSGFHPQFHLWQDSRLWSALH